MGASDRIKRVPIWYQHRKAFLRSYSWEHSYRDSSSTEKVEVEYPVGHRRRRAEGTPLLLQKARENLLTRFPSEQTERILQLCQDAERLEKMKVADFVDHFLPEAG